MNALSIRNLFSVADDNGADWHDTRHNLITRQTAAVQPEAFADNDATRAYFAFLETSPAGFTIFEFMFSDGTARPCSATGQFYDDESAEQACIALAKGRITPELCRGAYKSRNARTLDGIVIYKRNQARTSTIQEWREDQKTRVIPKKQPAAGEFVAAYVSEHFPKHAILELIERLQQSA